MGNILRLSIILLNVILYKIIDIKNIDIFIFNIILFNILSFCIFIFFDDFKNFRGIIDKVKENKEIKRIIFIELKKQFRNIYNWIVFLFPFIFYFISNLNHTVSEIEILFFLVMSIFLLINIIVLSSIIKTEHPKKYFIYIIVVGILYQIYTALFKSSFIYCNIFLFSFILLTYLSIIILSNLYSKKRNQSSKI